MEVAALALAALALVVALSAWARAGTAAVRAEDAQASLRRSGANAEEAWRRELAVLRELFARQVEGAALDGTMVREGLLWRDVDVAEARRLMDAGAVTLVDVRTPAETAAGVLPGARLLPMDQLEARLEELPRSGTLLVYCAGGVRSAAVCDALSREGFASLLNLEGGVASWDGPLVPPRE